MTADSYTCQRCWGVFTKGQTDAEAAAEFDSLFAEDAGPRDLVCDDCFKDLAKIHGWPTDD